MQTFLEDFVFKRVRKMQGGRERKCDDFVFKMVHTIWLYTQAEDKREMLTRKRSFG